MPRTRQRTKADFLIVGGGMAGIAALAEAKRQGIHAIGLEAQAKLGGRVRTVRNRRLADYPIELGPEFVHGPLMKALTDSLGLTLLRHPAEGVAFVDHELVPLAPMLAAFQTIRERAAAYLAAGHEDSSVEDFVESLQTEERVLPQQTNAHLLLQLIRNDYAARVSDLGLTGLLAPDVDGYEDNYRIAEGYSEVPRRLAEGCDVRVNHAASAVIRHADRVDVVTSRGVYSGNVAILCLPVGVLQAGDVHFDPPLSRAKHDAIGGVNPGAATKLVLAFRRTRMGETFWPDDAPLLATSLATQLWWPTGYGHADQRRFLTTCLVGGAGVARFAERDPREVGLAQLGHMFGWERVRGKALSQHYVKCWHDDPRIKGGYSSWSVGVDQTALVAALEAPEDEAHPQLYFAGDYVTQHPGAVHSAYQSGVDAVRRAAAALA